jgi:hypothetical protein
MKTKLVSLAAAALLLAGGAGAHAATAFNIFFDNTGGAEPDGQISAPLTGEGFFVSPVDLAPGVYNLSDLSGFSIDAFVGGEFFSTSNISTPIDEVAVDVTTYGSGERLVFTESSTGGDGGPYGGSLDLTAADGAALSFEPTYFGGHNLYEEFSADEGGSLFGNYLALSAPEPWAWSLMLIGLGGVGAALRRRRRAAAVSATA